MISGYRVTDLHVHIQPWEMHPPHVQHTMESGRADLDRIREFMESPKAFLSKFLISKTLWALQMIAYLEYNSTQT